MSSASTLRRVDWLADTIGRHKAGEPVGVYSVCSAHPTVLEAAIVQAADDDGFVLIEATSNQVDQFGGYTGLRPAEFRELVFGIADTHGFARDRVVLGGDHLGPNRWQRENAAVAMAHAETLIAAYVEAGYTKIHLDCSMRCADDPAVLADDVVAHRSAQLLRVAEDTARRAGSDGPVYVIGTEVPVPGGAHETLEQLTPTPAERARATLAAHRSAFADAGLGEVWPRVMALVVQPGVEFDHDRNAAVLHRRDCASHARLHKALVRRRYHGRFGKPPKLAYGEAAGACPVLYVVGGVAGLAAGVRARLAEPVELLPRKHF